MKTSFFKLCCILCLVGVSLSEALPLIAKSRVSNSFSPSFQLKPPSQTKGFQLIDLHSSRGASSFFYNNSLAYKISPSEAPHSIISTFSFNYAPGNGRMWNDVFGHSPDICLPMSGATLSRAFQPISSENLPPNIQLNQFIFNHPATPDPIQVFKLVWINQDNWINTQEKMKNHQSSRLKFLLQSSQTPEATLLMTVVLGSHDSEQALNLFRQYVLSHSTLFSSPITHY